MYGFTGKGKVLLRAATSGKYGYNSYILNQPIALFDDVDIELQFSNKETVAKKGITNLAADSSSEASILRVTNIKNSDSLFALLYRKREAEHKEITESKKLFADENGIILLPIESTDTIVPDSIFIFNSNKEMVTFNFDNVFTISGLNHEEYSVFYKKYIENISVFDLSGYQMPYVSLEVQIVGNISGVTGTMIMNITRASILNKPSLNFYEISAFSDSLEFALISQNKEPLEVVFYGH